MSTPRYERGDVGFSLVELAVYIVVLGIIAAIVAAVMVTLFKSEKTVSAVTVSTSDAQNAVSFLTKDIRNAREFRVSGTDGSMLIASVSGSDPNSITWQCVRWQVDGDKLVRSAASDPATGAPAWSPASPLIQGVQQQGVQPFFSGVGATDATGSLDYRFNVETTETGVLDASGKVNNRVASAGSGCFR